MIRTLASLAAQLARLIPYPEHRGGFRASARTAPGRSACGLCPACGAFVRVDVPTRDGFACPSCGEVIPRLAPLGSDGGETQPPSSSR